MNKYRVTLMAFAETTVSVEAENKEEALELAYDQAPGSLCHYCAGHYEINDWLYPGYLDRLTGPNIDVVVTEEN